MDKNIDKTLKLVLIFSLASVAVTVIMKSIKIIVLLSEKSVWDGTAFEGSIMTVIISAAVVIFVKIIRYTPRIVQLEKARKNHVENDMSILNKIYRLNKSFITVYVIIIVIDVVNLSKVQGDGIIIDVIKWFPIIATSISLVVAGGALWYSRVACIHFDIPRRRFNRR